MSETDTALLAASECMADAIGRTLKNPCDLNTRHLTESLQVWDRIKGIADGSQVRIKHPGYAQTIARRVR